MKALRFERFGDISELGLADVPTPRPGPREALIRVHAAAINPSDLANLNGTLRPGALPRIPGRDLAGVVVDGVREFLGQEVWAAGGELGFTRAGTHAEYAVIPAAAVRVKPRSLSMIEAAASGVPFVTAYLGLVELGQIKAGETVLITGAAGSVGGAAIQIAKWKGARVIGFDRRPPAGEGVDLALGPEADLAAAARSFTSGKGGDLVFDAVGGNLFEPALETLGESGRHVAIASRGERRVSFDLVDFYHRQLVLRGLDTLAWDLVASTAVLERLRPAFEHGLLTPPAIAQVYPLERAAEAYGEVAAGNSAGKIVLRML